MYPLGALPYVNWMQHFFWLKHTAWCRSYLTIRSFLIAWGLRSTTKVDRKDGKEVIFPCWREGMCLSMGSWWRMLTYVDIIFCFCGSNSKDMICLWCFVSSLSSQFGIALTYLYTMRIQSLRLDIWRGWTKNYISQCFQICIFQRSAWMRKKCDERNAQEIGGLLFFFEIHYLDLRIDHFGPQDVLVWKFWIQIIRFPTILSVHQF